MCNKDKLIDIIKRTLNGRLTVATIDRITPIIADAIMVNSADIKIVRGKECARSTAVKNCSRYDLYVNNYDVRWCNEYMKIVCGSHYCGFGLRRRIFK